MKHLLFTALLVLPSLAAEAKTLTATMGANPFPGEELADGSTGDAAQCATLPLAAWVTVDGKGDCVRAYGAGLRQGSNPNVLVYLSGDRLAGRRILGGYAKESPDSLSADADRWARQAGMPYLFLARPGTYGSSGNHAERRRPREGRLIDAALQALKSRHAVGAFHLAGQSGGGGLVANMLNVRSDVGCAVAASGAVAVNLRTQLLNRSKDTTGYSDSYDPVAHVKDITRRPGLRIFVLSDRHDQTVPFKSQEYYVDELRKPGFAPVHIELNAKAPAHHDLVAFAKPALVWCAQGKTDSEIETALKAMDRQNR